MRKSLIALSASMLTFAYLTPATTGFAKELNTYPLSQQTMGGFSEKVQQAVSLLSEEEEISVEEMERLWQIAQQCLVTTDEGTYTFDEAKAISLGLTVDEATNLNNGYESFTTAEVQVFNDLKRDKVEYPGPDPSPGVTTQAVAGVVVISLPILLNMLLAAGAAWLVKEILELGAYAACKKWGKSSKAPKIFKLYCEHKGWA